MDHSDIMGRAERLRRALQSIENVTVQKEQVVCQKAKDTAAGAGESDLRRLKRQFTSLKNTYMLYDTKEHFLDGLLDGLPSGQEGEDLLEIEEQVKTQGARVKQSKNSTAEMQEQISGLTSKATELHEELERERAAASAHLNRLATISAGVDPAKQQPLPQLPEGPEEDGCAKALTEEAATARQLESAIASDEAQATELAAAIAAEEEELLLLRAQLSEVGAAGEEDGQLRGQGEASKYGNTVAWCQDVQQLLGVLSGVTVLRIEEDCVAVRLLTSFHSTWEALGDKMETMEHELTLQLGDGNGKLADAGLSPPSVDISDIVSAAQRGCGGFKFVVREVHARLAARMHRAALIRESGERLKLQPYDSDSESLRALLPRSGATAELCVPMHWPAKGVPLQLKSISTGQDTVDLLQAMAVMQKLPELAYSSIASLLQAVDEAVSSLLAQAGQEASA